MENQSFGGRVKTSAMKFLRRLLVWGTVILVVVGAFLYFGTFEKGIYAGKVLRISERGLIFKTYEGQLSSESFGSLKGASPIAETRDFSVEAKQTEVIKQLEEVALSGERVNLHFRKRFITFPWRGETNCFIESVERTK
jgi:hypothetical protein